MNSTVTYRQTFSAIHDVHLVDADTYCFVRPHGHRWRVSITVGLGVDPKTGSIRADWGQLLSLTDELDGESLNTLLPMIFPTPENLAAYVAERLRASIAGLSSVTVDMDDDVSATVSF